MSDVIATNGVWVQFGLNATQCRHCDHKYDPENCSQRYCQHDGSSCNHQNKGGWYNMFRSCHGICGKLPYKQWSLCRESQNNPLESIICMLGNAIYPFLACAENKEYTHAEEDDVLKYDNFDPLDAIKDFMCAPQSRIARSQNNWILSIEKAKQKEIINDEYYLGYASDLYHGDSMGLWSRGQTNTDPVRINGSPCYDSTHLYYFVECDSRGNPITKEKLKRHLKITPLITDLQCIVIDYCSNFEWQDIYSKWMKLFG